MVAKKLGVVLFTACTIIIDVVGVLQFASIYMGSTIFQFLASHLFIIAGIMLTITNVGIILYWKYKETREQLEGWRGITQQLVLDSVKNEERFTLSTASIWYQIDHLYTHSTGGFSSVLPSEPYTIEAEKQHAEKCLRKAFPKYSTEKIDELIKSFYNEHN